MQVDAEAGTDRGPAQLEDVAGGRRGLLEGSLEDRAAVRGALMAGEVCAALEALAKARPGLLEERPVLRFELRCLEFVGLVRSGRLGEALVLAQAELGPFADSPGGGDGPEDAGAAAGGRRVRRKRGEAVPGGPKEEPIASAPLPSPPEPSPLEYALRLREVMALLAYTSEWPSARLCVCRPVWWL
jgi:hypothetical protein